MCLQKCRKISNLSLSCVFFQALDVPKLVFGAGFRPGPRLGSLRRFPRPPSRLRRGHLAPLPHILPRRRLWRLDLGASMLKINLISSKQNSWLRLCRQAVAKMSSIWLYFSVRCMAAADLLAQIAGGRAVD